MFAARCAELRLQQPVSVRIELSRRFHRRVHLFNDDRCSSRYSYHDEKKGKQKNMGVSVVRADRYTGRFGL